MSARLPDELLAQVSGLIAEHLGLHFPPARWRDLERGLGYAAPELGFADAAGCAAGLIASGVTNLQLEVLAGHLTIGETYFFRETQSFDLLRHSLFPELLPQRQNGRRLRLWSAGCCTGEEPYSIAILLSQLLPDLPAWHITLLATDLNRRFLDRAEAGIYGDWSFRRTPPAIKARYFTAAPDGRYQLAEPLRKMVTFAYLNLALDAYPSLSTNTNAMDIIFCRNVLMYFDPEHARRVVRGFHAALVEGGWLIVSPSEASQVLFSQFETVSHPEVILYRKRSNRPQPSVAAPVTTWTPPPPPVPPAQVAPQIEWTTLQPEAPPPVETPAPAAFAAAQALYDQGRYTEAEAAAEALVAADPSHGEALGLLTRLCANQGRLDEALTWCRRALAVDRLNPAWPYLEATLQTERGEEAAAAQALKRALYLDPEFVLAHYALGHLARRQGQPAAASRHFTNALALLANQAREALLPESDGLTAGRLSEIISSTLGQAVPVT